MFENLKSRNIKILVQIIILCFEIINLQIKHSLLDFNIMFYQFIIFYQLDFLSVKIKFKHTLNTAIKNSCFLELPKFIVVFLKLGLVRTNMSVSLKGEICSKINYKENLVILELVYGGAFATLSFPLVITTLIGLVCEEQYKESLVHPNLIFPYQTF